MPCPYFIPLEKLDAPLWPHPMRLPLAAGWLGECGAPGYAGTRVSETEAVQACNLGYASGCPRLPAERNADAVRFIVALSEPGLIRLQYVYERAHQPAGGGMLEFDPGARCWRMPVEDACLRRQAECYLQTWMSRRQAAAAAK